MDLAEAKNILENHVTRETLKKLLQSEICRLENLKMNNERVLESSKKKTYDNLKTVTNYAWDQVDEYVKLYLPLDEQITQEKVKLNFSNPRSVVCIYGRNKLTLNKLYADINKKESHCKVTKSKVILFLKKDSKKHWPSLIEKKDFKYEPEKEEEITSDKSSAGLGDLLKKLYNEGDDEMKRMISKAWYEAQNNKTELNVDKM